MLKESIHCSRKSAKTLSRSPSSSSRSFSLKEPQIIKMESETKVKTSQSIVDKLFKDFMTEKLSGATGAENVSKPEGMQISKILDMEINSIQSNVSMKGPQEAEDKEKVSSDREISKIERLKYQKSKSTKRSRHDSTSLSSPVRKRKKNLDNSTDLQNTMWDQTDHSAQSTECDRTEILPVSNMHDKSYSEQTLSSGHLSSFTSSSRSSSIVPSSGSVPATTTGSQTNSKVERVVMNSPGNIPMVDSKLTEKSDSVTEKQTDPTVVDNGAPSEPLTNHDVAQGEVTKKPLMLPTALAKKQSVPKQLGLKLTSMSLSLIKSNERMDADGRIWEDGEVNSSHSEAESQSEPDAGPSEAGSVNSDTGGEKGVSRKSKKKHKHKHKKKKKKSSSKDKEKRSQDKSKGKSSEEKSSGDDKRSGRNSEHESLRHRRSRERDWPRSKEDKRQERSEDEEEVTDRATKDSRSSKRNRVHSRSRSKSPTHEKSSYKRKSRSRSPHRSRSPKSDRRHHRSRASSKSPRRSRADEWDASLYGSDYGETSMHYSRSRSASRDRSKKSSRHRDSKGKSSRLQIDKAQLRRIAIANALVNMKASQAAAPQVLEVPNPIVKTSGKSVEELTEFCKKISEKNNAGEESAVSDSSEEEVAQASDDDDTLIHHPFKIREPPSTGIIMNIRNSKQLPILTPLEKQTQKATLRLAFPVSSGSHHRASESEWVPVERPTSSQAATKPSSQPPPAGRVIEMPAPPVQEEVKRVDSIFPDPAEAQKLDIGTIISERLHAVRKLQQNPYDVQALSTMHKAQEKASQWASSKHLPGQFTGSTGAKVLSQAELIGDKKHQAWARKTQLTQAPPVMGGIGMALLQKMGWKHGEGLGKNNEGNKEPLLLNIKVDRKGLSTAVENPHAKAPAVPMPRAKDLSCKHPVSALMELCNRRKWGPPSFTVVDESGPDHKKNFLFKVKVNNVEYQPAVPSSNKKTAKAQCAAVCLQEMGLLPRDAPLNI